MQEKIKVITIGDYKDSTLENYFRDNENIEFLELTLNENIEKLDNKLSNRDIVFLRSNELETLLEIGKALKEKGINVNEINYDEANFLRLDARQSCPDDRSCVAESRSWRLSLSGILRPYWTKHSKKRSRSCRHQH